MDKNSSSAKPSGEISIIISLTNLADLQTGMRCEGDSVWLEAPNRG